MMKMQATLPAICGLVVIAGTGFSQNYLAESQTALNMQNDLNGQLQQGPPPVPGQVPGVGNPSTGFAPGAIGGNAAPGFGNPGLGGGQGFGAGAEGLGGLPGQAGQVGVAAPAPIPTETVLYGRRVYDAVSGGLLEDPMEISVRQSDAEAYPDDGISDNGIAGDGVRGNVNTLQSDFIGQFSNNIKNHLVHAVSNAEQIDPMVYYGYHFAKIDPSPVEGMKRYGLPLPNEDRTAKVAHVEPDFPSIIDLERDRDELVRKWNQDFLAEYRVDPNNPQSEYYPVFIPSPPLTPANYPVPNGYVAPQAVAVANENAAVQVQAAAIAQQASTKVNSRGGGLGGGLGF